MQAAFASIMIVIINPPLLHLTLRLNPRNTQSIFHCMACACSSLWASPSLITACKTESDSRPRVPRAGLKTSHAPPPTVWYTLYRICIFQFIMIGFDFDED
jgi:hypothetical protein